MLPTSNARPSKLMLAALLPLMSACAASLPVSPPAPVPPPRIPPLPLNARQPPPPPQCLLTCSAGAANDAQSSLDTLMTLGLPASSASGPTTR